MDAPRRKPSEMGAAESRLKSTVKSEVNRPESLSSTREKQKEGPEHTGKFIEVKLNGVCFAELNKEAWESPGKFIKASSENELRLEGWLSRFEEPRSSKDVANQQQAKSGLTNTDGIDALHMIPHCNGGPSEANRSEHAKDNLFAGDARVNRSHLNVVDMEMNAKLKNMQIYEVAVLKYNVGADGKRIPASIVKSFYTKGEGGEPALIKEWHAAVNYRPGKTMRGLVASQEQEDAKREKRKPLLAKMKAESFSSHSHGITGWDVNPKRPRPKGDGAHY